MMTTTTTTTTKTKEHNKLCVKIIGRTQGQCCCWWWILIIEHGSSTLCFQIFGEASQQKGGVGGSMSGLHGLSSAWDSWMTTMNKSSNSREVVPPALWVVVVPVHLLLLMAVVVVSLNHNNNHKWWWKWWDKDCNDENGETTKTMMTMQFQFMEVIIHFSPWMVMMEVKFIMEVIVHSCINLIHHVNSQKSMLASSLLVDMCRRCRKNWHQCHWLMIANRESKVPSANPGFQDFFGSSQILSNCAQK